PWRSRRLGSDYPAASSSTIRTVCEATAMKLQDGYDAPGRARGPGHAGVSLPQNGAWVPRPWCRGADRAWWSDWSSKPAGVRMDLGRFDSYTLPPRPVHLLCRTAATRLRRPYRSLARYHSDHPLHPVALPLR